MDPLLFILDTSELFELWREDYMTMEMTPIYWQSFASQQTDQLLLPPLTGTWQGFRGGAINGAWY